MKLARALCCAFAAGLTVGVGASPASAIDAPDVVHTAWQLWLEVGSYFMAASFGFATICLFRINKRLHRKISEGHDKEAHAENELEHHRRRLCAIFDNAVVGLAVAGPDGRYLEVNARFARMLGYRREEICALQHFSITHPDDISASRQHLAALVAGKVEFFTFDKRLMRQDGSTVWVSMSASPIHGAHGEIESVICIIQDINERKMTEERLHHILRDLPIATLVVDAARRITHQSAKFEALFGYTVNDVTALHDWLPLAYPDPTYREHARKIGAEIAAVSRQTGHASGPVELRVRCKDGTNKAIEFHYVDLLDQGIWMMNDVTEQNYMEESMRAINDHLMERLGEINSLQEQLRQQAMHDSLTGLFNRRYLDEMLERELARAKREGPPLTVMMLDIDYFKKLNDTYGHQAGDEVLRCLADLLRDHSRAEDIPCRYGGEEFLLVLPNMGRDDALSRAEQWRHEFEVMRMRFGKDTLSSTISIGIATFPDHGHTRDTLIEAADKALYAAKHNGRNRVEMSP